MNFYPRPPWGGRRDLRRQLCRLFCISIHALRGEGDTTGKPKPTTRQNFYPRPPWGGRQTPVVFAGDDLFISIHALRGEGDACQLNGDLGIFISIHALRGEGDPPSV